jgi:hypothetical protein
MRAVPRAVAEPNRAIQSFSREIDAIIVRKDPEVDLRMTQVEGPKARQKPARCKRADDTDRQYLAQAAILESLQDLVDSTEGIGDHREERFAFFRQSESPGQTPEQLHAQTVFQNLHLLADGGLRHAKLETGLGKAQMSRRSLK